MRACGLGYLRILDGKFNVPVQIEESNVLSNGIHIVLDTAYKNSQDWESSVGSMPAIFAAAANAYGIGVEPLAPSPDAGPWKSEYDLACLPPWFRRCVAAQFT